MRGCARLRRRCRRLVWSLVSSSLVVPPSPLATLATPPRRCPLPSAPPSIRNPIPGNSGSRRRKFCSTHIYRILNFGFRNPFLDLEVPHIFSILVLDFGIWFFGFQYRILVRCLIMDCNVRLWIFWIFGFGIYGWFRPITYPMASMKHDQRVIIPTVKAMVMIVMGGRSKVQGLRRWLPRGVRRGRCRFRGVAWWAFTFLNRATGRRVCLSTSMPN